MADNKRQIEALREFLRQPENRVTKTDPVSRHHDAMKSIWEQGLKLAEGDPKQALEICEEAVRSSQQPGESRQQYIRRLDGIPSHAFGIVPPYAGVDKPQHFFATAYQAYIAGESWGKTAGRAYEIKDLISDKLFGGGHGGYDRGDIAADDRGAKFGAALDKRHTEDKRHTDVDKPDTKLPPIDIRDYLPNEGSQLEPIEPDSSDIGLPETSLSSMPVEEVSFIQDSIELLSELNSFNMDTPNNLEPLHYMNPNFTLPETLQTVQPPEALQSVQTTELQQNIQSLEALQSIQPPELNQSITPPELNQSIAPPEVNQSVQPPELNQSIAPPEVNQSIQPPEVNQNLAPPDSGYDGGSSSAEGYNSGSSDASGYDAGNSSAEGYDSGRSDAGGYAGGHSDAGGYEGGSGNAGGGSDGGGDAADGSG